MKTRRDIKMFEILGTEEYLDSSIAIESITNKIENTN